MKTETKGHQGNHAAQRGQIHPRLESEQIPTRHGCSGPDWHPKEIHLKFICLPIGVQVASLVSQLS